MLPGNFLPESNNRLLIGYIMHVRGHAYVGVARPSPPNRRFQAVAIDVASGYMRTLRTNWSISSRPIPDAPPVSTAIRFRNSANAAISDNAQVWPNVPRDFCY